MIKLHNIIVLTTLLFILLVLGSMGFVWIEGWDFFDSLYMTVTTLTTVGYQEVHPLSRAGKTYNIVLILAGMGVLFYILSILARVVVEGEIQEALGRHKFIKELK